MSVSPDSLVGTNELSTREATVMSYSRSSQGLLALAVLLSWSLAMPLGAATAPAGTGRRDGQPLLAGQAAGAAEDQDLHGAGGEEARAQQGRRRRARLDGHVLPRRRLQPRGADDRRRRRAGDDRLHRQRQRPGPPRSQTPSATTARATGRTAGCSTSPATPMRAGSARRSSKTSGRWTPPIPGRSSSSWPSACRTSPSALRPGPGQPRRHMDGDAQRRHGQRRGMRLAPFVEALAALKAAGAPKIDLIKFDMCLMAQVEVMDAIAPYASLASPPRARAGHRVSEPPGAPRARQQSEDVAAPVRPDDGPGVGRLLRRGGRGHRDQFGDRPRQGPGPRRRRRRARRRARPGARPRPGRGRAPGPRRTSTAARTAAGSSPPTTSASSWRSSPGRTKRRRSGPSSRRSRPPSEAAVVEHAEGRPTMARPVRDLLPGRTAGSTRDYASIPFSRGGWDEFLQRGLAASAAAAGAAAGSACASRRPIRPACTLSARGSRCAGPSRGAPP